MISHHINVRYLACVNEHSLSIECNRPCTEHKLKHCTRSIQVRLQHEESLTSDVLSLYLKKNIWLYAKIVYQLIIIIIMLNIVIESFN